MGGLFSAPVAPVQSNEGQLMLAKEQGRQNDLMYAQAEEARAAQGVADDAAMENLREIEIRDAEAKQQSKDLEEQAARGKKDLLYKSSLGVEDDEEGEDMLRLGGA